MRPAGQSPQVPMKNHQQPAAFEILKAMDKIIVVMKGKR
jgi:hypothetical protein